METREIDLAKLADTVREVRADLTKLAHREPLKGWEGQRVCVCGLDPHRCDTRTTRGGASDRRFGTRSSASRMRFSDFN